jgi:hypothetical protein
VEILERGVDGIMTDRSALVREIIDAWRAARGHATGGGGP